MDVNRDGLTGSVLQSGGVLTPRLNADMNADMISMRQTKLKLDNKWKRKQQNKDTSEWGAQTRTNTHVYSTHTASMLFLCDVLLRGYTHALSGTQMLRRHVLDVSDSPAVRKRGLQSAAEMG